MAGTVAATVAAYGTVRREPADEFAKKSGATRILVRFNDQTSTWWVKDSGEQATTGMGLRPFLSMEYRPSSPPEKQRRRE